MKKEIVEEPEAKTSEFSVATYSILDKDCGTYIHWSEGLKMLISKDGVDMVLNSEEIQQLVKALPRTMGGSY